MPVAAQAHQDHAFLAGLAGGVGLVEDGSDRVGRLGRGQDGLGPGEADRRLEGLVLAVGARLHEAVLDQAADHR